MFLFLLVHNSQLRCQDVLVFATVNTYISHSFGDRIKRCFTKTNWKSQQYYNHFLNHGKKTNRTNVGYGATSSHTNWKSTAPEQHSASTLLKMSGNFTVNGFTQINQTLTADMAAIVSITRTDVAVSYTHLDVYKRQGLLFVPLERFRSYNMQEKKNGQRSVLPDQGSLS